VRIHRPLLDTLIVAEGAGLAEQLVDKGRLAVIDVGDDRHVAKAHLLILFKDRGKVRAGYSGFAALQQEQPPPKAAISGPRARPGTARLWQEFGPDASLKPFAARPVSDVGRGCRP